MRTAGAGIAKVDDAELDAPEPACKAPLARRSDNVLSTSQSCAEFESRLAAAEVTVVVGGSYGGRSGCPGGGRG